MRAGSDTAPFGCTEVSALEGVDVSRASRQDGGQSRSDTDTMTTPDAKTAYFGLKLWVWGGEHWVDRLGPGGHLDEDSPSFAPVPESQREDLRDRLVALLEENRDRAMAVLTLGELEYLCGPGSMGPFQILYFE